MGFRFLLLSVAENASVPEAIDEAVSVITDLPGSKDEVGGYLTRLWTMLEEFAVTYGGRLLISLVLLLIGFKVINSLTRKMGNGKLISKVDPATGHFITTLIGGAAKMLIGVTALAILGVPMSSIIAVIGSCGLAIGLALQGSLANIAGGFLILLLKPFRVGDFIVAQGVEGTVEYIGIFQTHVITIDNRRTVVPNATLSNATLTNVSALPERRVDLTFTAAYSDDIKKVEAVLLEVCEKNEKVLKTPAPFARLSNHLDSALEYTVRAWCLTPDYWDVYFDLYEQVKVAFDENGITIPFPQVDVHSENKDTK
ncbi:MAG: mechanosensitive ion channel family protein [Clostridia bacterium]|nr:mechanosensitive ion channel family protein [Clostridia bacterium]